MDNTPLLSYEGMKQRAIPCMYYLNILGIPFIIGLFYALLVMESDCADFNRWLWAEVVAQIAITAASISQISKRFISKATILIKLPFALLILSQIALLVYGTVMIFTNFQCFEKFPEAYVMIASISLVAYISILVLILLYLITVIVEARNKRSRAN